MNEHKSTYDVAADVIRARSSHQPRVGLVLGSGLGGLADALERRDVISSHDLPGWPHATVEGHSGNLVLGLLEGQTVVAQQGRAHSYASYPPPPSVFPSRGVGSPGVGIVGITKPTGGVG
ncbi:MAG: purine-nucleoside phosphorylase, partial [Anaerolineaceae bacterium]|nr:purine-nucleoside phosphorylase [Anaerolineaceae bacterium]